MDVAGFALAVLLIELTPGPNMAWLAGLAAADGWRRGLAAVAGVAVGLAVNGILAALGLAALLRAAPETWIWLRLAGAAMMVWLAVETWRGAGRAERASADDVQRRRTFVAGMVLNLLNPKAYLFFVVVAPQFTGGAGLSLAQALVLSLISVGIATAVHLAIVLAGSRAHDWLIDPRRTVVVRRSFALVMLGVAVAFLLADLRAPG